MDEKMIEKLAGAMVYCQVDVCGIGMFRAPNFAKEVVEVLKESGYEIEIRPTQRAADFGWTCEVCQSTNLESDLECGYCDTPRPSR